MRNKTKTLFIGGAFACIGSLSGHGETFQQKLDAYFAEYAQEIQESIQAWDMYNKHKPEYHITEQELKDVVMRSYKKTIDWMKLSMQHQIRFFDYCRMHLCEGDTASLKKRFDGEQIRIHALRELGDMREKFTQRGIDYPKLEELYDACSSYQPDPNYPEGLRNHLLQTVGEDSNDAVAGGRMYYERTSEDAYAIERLYDFWNKLLCSSHDDWVGRLRHYEISVDFHNGYCTYTKWNPVAYPAIWHAATPPYPNCCLRKHENTIDKMFEDEGLIRTYGKVMELLQECINDACRLYGMYRDTLAVLAVRRGRLQKPQDWYGKVLKRCETLFTYWRAQYYAPLADAVKIRDEFETVAEALEKIKGCLLELCNKVRNSITQ